MSRDNIAQNFEKEHIYIVEIDVPRCVNTYGSAPCTASGSGDDKCYNTRATCQDLANYNDRIDTGLQTIGVNATNRTFIRSSGSYLTDGFEAGMTITKSGSLNDGNNSQFVIESVTANTITVTSASSFGLVTEAGNGDEQITAPNLYTYGYCSARSPHPQNLNNYAPSISNVSIAPAKVDPRGGIGARTSATVNFNDFPSSDRYGIDPYLSDRTFDPLTKGLHFTKWRTRNANYENYQARILSGYIVDNTFDPANFETRYYVISSMTATNGKASFTFKDPLQLVSNKKALAPRPSNGLLNAALTDSATSFTLTPTGVGNDEYPSSNFYVKIADEVLFCGSRSGDSVTSVTRGQKNTTAAAHDADDTVQLCLEYTGEAMDKVQYDLCVNFANIPAIYVPAGQWESEVDTFLSGNPNALITDPTPVNKLISELCEQWPHKLFWSDRENLIEMVAIKEPPTLTSALTDENNIISLTTRDRPEMQLSTVFVHYGQLNPTKKLDEVDNYKVSYARVNTDAIARYDSNNSKIIYSRWIPDSLGAAARQTAALIGRRFGITPREVNFKLEDKDSDVWVGDVKRFQHFDIVDQSGDATPTTFEVISSQEGQDYSYNALEFNYDEFQDGDQVLGVDVVDIPEDRQNYNMRTEYESNFGTPDASTVAKFIIYSGAVVHSTSTGTPSMVTGTWPAGATITLQINTGGYLVGAGGNGSGSTGSAGGAGGDALSLGYDVELINNGILGGGGGGGGATAGTAIGGATPVAGGGGGAGRNLSTAVTPPDPTTRGGAGAGNTYTGTDTIVVDNPGDNGTKDAGGAGGNLTINISEPEVTAGVSGGDLGQVGTTSDSAGGAAGKAVDLNGFTLTQTVSGDIRGAVS